MIGEETGNPLLHEWRRTMTTAPGDFRYTLSGLFYGDPDLHSPHSVHQFGHQFRGFYASFSLSLTRWIRGFSLPFSMHWKILPLFTDFCNFFLFFEVNTFSLKNFHHSLIKLTRKETIKLINWIFSPRKEVRGEEERMVTSSVRTLLQVFS